MVLDHLPRDPGHIRRLPSKDVIICPEEGDERAFLFRIEVAANLDGLRRVVAERHFFDQSSIFREGSGPPRGRPRELWEAPIAAARCSRQVQPLSTEHGVLEICWYRDRALGPGNLDGEVCVMGRRHELRERGTPEDAVIREIDLGDIKGEPSVL